jgi:polysaccharide biosynthesis protein PslG
LIRKIAPIAMALALLGLPACAGGAVPPASISRVPPGFLGISPQAALTEPDLDLMERAGLRSIRLPLFWSRVEAADPYLAEPRWDGFDRNVALAARHGIQVLPFVWGTPAWVFDEERLEPVESAFQRQAWASFLRSAVERYGPDGSFWRDNPELPYVPIRRWEIWNEANIVTFGKADPERFAHLIRLSGRILHRADPGVRLILGGLFGRPLQVPPNVHPGQFLARVYRSGDVKRWFDGVALHPYVSRARAMRGQIENLRRVMRLHGDAATPLFVTELGWGSDSFESRWERGRVGQAEELDRALTMLYRHRRNWRIGGVWWFSWIDADGACQFCDSAGLLTQRREAKPSWYVFNAWTGGDPFTVPEAAFGD